LQTASIIAAFPFAFVIIGMAFSLFKSMQEDNPRPKPIRSGEK